MGQDLIFALLTDVNIIIKCKMEIIRVQKVNADRL